MEDTTMTTLSHTTIEFVKQWLINKEVRILLEIDQLDLYGDHRQDPRQKQYRHTKLLAQLHQVRSALAKIDAGTFGICERCDKAIKRGRLISLPTSALCYACKVDLETNDSYRGFYYKRSTSSINS
jgi:RNA polymerase-binding transcription factor DksA